MAWIFGLVDYCNTITDYCNYYLIIIQYVIALQQDKQILSEEFEPFWSKHVFILEEK